MHAQIARLDHLVIAARAVGLRRRSDLDDAQLQESLAQHDTPRGPVALESKGI